MYGITMSAAAEEEWQKYIKFYDNKQMDPEVAKILGDFVMADYNDILTNPQKQNELRKVIGALSYEMNIRLNGVQIIADPNLRLMGGYDNKTNSMLLNVGCKELWGFDKVKVLTTIVHELRHAQQHHFLRHLPDSEFGQRIGYGLDNYDRPGATIVRDSLYYSNIVEVDAEAASYEILSSMFSKLKENATTPEMKDTLRWFSSKNEAGKKEFLDTLEASQDIVEASRDARKILFDGVEKYGEQLFSPKNAQNDIFTEDSSKIMVEQLESLIAGSSGKQIIDFTEPDLYWLKKRFYEGRDIFQVVEHLDDPMVKYIEELEQRFNELGLDSYGKYREKLLTLINNVKTLYAKHGVECKDASNSEVLKMGLELFPKFMAQNVAEPTKKDLVSSTNNTFLSYTCYVRGVSEKIAEEAARLTMETVPQENIRALIENIQDTSSEANFSSPLFYVNVMNHYGALYSPYNRKKLETFLNNHGIKTDKLTFSQCYDAYQKIALKIIGKNITREKDSSREDKDAAFCAYYCDLTPEMLRAELSKIPFAKAKLEKMLKQEKPSTIVEILKAARFDFDEVFNPTNQKNKTTQTQG